MVPSGRIYWETAGSISIVNISSAIFEGSAPDLGSCPDESLPEFAFIGRSNVGKSSLLNMLSGQRDLARVSPTPGHTKLINFFTMNRTWRLVDLPGYGFAQVARKDKARFNQAVADFLQHRPNLALVFELIDSSLPPQAMDLEFVEWLARNSIPFVLVFTKVDRSKPEKVQANIQAFKARIAGWFEQLPEVYTCSAQTRQGRTELLGLIDTAIREMQTEERPPVMLPDEEEEFPAADLPPVGDVPRGKPKGPKRPNPGRIW